MHIDEFFQSRDKIMKKENQQIMYIDDVKLTTRVTTKGLQDRNIHILDGTTVENKGKLILPTKEVEI